MAERDRVSIGILIAIGAGTLALVLTTGKVPPLSSPGPKLSNERANLRDADAGNLGERCGFCQYFKGPNQCQIVHGPVATDLVCDWIQSRDTNAPLYRVDDQDWLAFGRGMVETQPYQHMVRDAALTPVGPLVLIEDTAQPRPHRFSLNRDFHIGHTSLEHHWTQAEVDSIIGIGRDGAS